MSRITTLGSSGIKQHKILAERVQEANKSCVYYAKVKKLYFVALVCRKPVGMPYYNLARKGEKRNSTLNYILLSHVRLELGDVLFKSRVGSIVSPS